MSEGSIGHTLPEGPLPGLSPTVASRIVPMTDEPLPRPFGRYELRRRLGAGGMGQVYLAHDPQLDRLVALKVPNPVAAEGWRERFLVEARAAANLTHPNICPVFEVGEADGRPYLTMAYIEGETLAARLAQEGPLAPAAAAALVATVARAMEEAHRRGIVHRDLKPQNVMLDPAGRPVVMDFGLAVRTTAADDLRLTLTGVALGTPAYMPPEQAGGDADAVGPPADVYALGTMLYEMVTGRVPFRAKPFGKLLAQIERDAPPPPRQLNPHVDPALEAVILTCLAKRPADRFPSAGPLADALDRYSHGDRGELVAEFSRPFLVPDATEVEPATPATTVALRPRRRWWRAAVVVVLLSVAAAVGVYVRTDHGELEVRLSDPNAKVEVRVNGQPVALSADGRVPRVRAGRGQTVEVSGADYEPVRATFDLDRGATAAVAVSLVPKDRPAPPAIPAPNVAPGPRNPAPDPMIPTLLVPLGGAAELDLKARGVPANFAVPREDVLSVRVDPSDPRKLVLSGRIPGLTRLSVVFADKTRAEYDVVVQPDMALLRNIIRRTVPSAEVDVTPGIGSVVILTGSAPTQEDVDAVIRIAASAVGGPSNVISTIKVAPAPKP
jgi:hypothetical protein